jgi:mono/diheme cytochrome c family protein
MFKKIKKTAILSSIALGVTFASFTMTEDNTQDKETFFLSDDDSLSDIYKKLGKIDINTVNTSIEGVSAEKGRDLVLTGSSAKENGKGRTSTQSPYFLCTACHNTEKEFDNLSKISSQNRLDYAEKNDLPFLQGTSFYGLVNRISFYNDDYQKKYGHIPIIKASNKDIRQAIQLCATQCSQGRALEDWEIESVLAYYWTLELKIKDLKLPADHKAKIEETLNNGQDGPRAVHLLQACYMDKSPAHFVEEKMYKPLDASMKNDKKRFKNGKIIYDRSCLHCHKGKKYSFFSLDDNKLSFVNLLNRTKKGKPGSLHKITRHGTWPLAGKRAYMPLYPNEKLSADQLDDLTIYIENMAQGNNLITDNK